MIAHPPSSRANVVDIGVIPRTEERFSKLDQSFLAGKKVLITGHSGFLGSALAACLSISNLAELRVLSRRPEAWMPNIPESKLVPVAGDIASPRTWRKALDGGVDYVFHLAAAPADTEDPYLDFDTNCAAVMHLLRECNRIRISPKIIFASSATIAGDVKELPVDESVPCDPRSLWSFHKFVAEKFLAHYRKVGSLRTVSLRLANMYGPVQNDKAYLNVVLHRITHSAINQNKIFLYHNRHKRRDFLHVDDAVYAVVYAARFLDDLPQDFFYIGSGEGISFAEIAKQVQKNIYVMTGTEVRIILNSKQLNQAELREFIADTTIFNKFTGWAPSIKVSDGIWANTKYALHIFRKERALGQHSRDPYVPSSSETSLPW